MNEKKPVSRRSSPSDQPLAAILKRRRESLDISSSEAEQATRIRAKYIEAIEAGDYDTLKDDVYSRGYVKNYADYLGLDTKPILKIYEQERAGQREMRRQSHRGRDVQLGVQPIKRIRWVVTPKTVALVSVLSILALVVGYIAWQVAILSAPPHLSISMDEPRTVEANFGYVAGRVDGGADLFINDSPVLVGTDGAFRERIALVEGRNEIRLTARNRLGKQTTQTYVITARPDTLPTPTPTPSADPAAPVSFDGVKVVVRITDDATWLIVEADGKEIFRGTMLPGASQTFSAADSIVLSTGNAGYTNVVLSNNVAQNKESGTLGAVGEVRRAIEYRRDTKV